MCHLFSEYSQFECLKPGWPLGILALSFFSCLAAADDSVSAKQPAVTAQQMKAEVCQTSLQMGSIEELDQELEPAGESAPLGEWQLRRYIVNYNGSDGYQILRVVARIFNEYPRSYLKITDEGVFLKVPKDRFGQIFKRSYAEVMEQLSRVTVMVTTEYESSEALDSYEPFLLAGEESPCFEAEAGGQTGEDFCFALHSKFGKLMKFQEEPAVVGIFTEEGSVFHREVNRANDTRQGYW